MGLRGGRTRGDSRVCPLLLSMPDIAPNVASGVVPSRAFGALWARLRVQHRPLWEAVQLEGKPTLMFWGAEPVS